MKTATPITYREEFLCIRLMTTEQLCAELNIKRQTLYRWRCAGMPYVPLGVRAVRYSLHDVLEMAGRAQERF